MRKFVVLATVAALTFAGLVGAAPMAGAQTSPTVHAPLKVVPAQNLNDGDTVKVSAPASAGWKTGGASFTIYECSQLAAAGCDTSTANPTAFTANADGSFDVAFKVHRMLYPSSGNRDCAREGGCVIIVADGNAANVGYAPITFVVPTGETTTTEPPAPPEENFDNADLSVEPPGDCPLLAGADTEPKRLGRQTGVQTLTGGAFRTDGCNDTLVLRFSGGIPNYRFFYNHDSPDTPQYFLRFSGASDPTYGVGALTTPGMARMVALNEFSTGAGGVQPLSIRVDFASTQRPSVRVTDDKNSIAIEFGPPGAEPTASLGIDQGVEKIVDSLGASCRLNGEGDRTQACAPTINGVSVAVNALYDAPRPDGMLTELRCLATPSGADAASQTKAANAVATCAKLEYDGADPTEASSWASEAVLDAKAARSEIGSSNGTISYTRAIGAGRIRVVGGGGDNQLAVIVTGLGGERGCRVAGADYAGKLASPSLGAYLPGFTARLTRAGLDKHGCADRVTLRFAHDPNTPSYETNYQGSTLHVVFGPKASAPYAPDGGKLAPHGVRHIQTISKTTNGGVLDVSIDLDAVLPYRVLHRIDSHGRFELTLEFGSDGPDFPGTAPVRFLTATDVFSAAQHERIMLVGDPIQYGSTGTYQLLVPDKGAFSQSPDTFLYAYVYANKQGNVLGLECGARPLNASAPPISPLQGLLFFQWCASRGYDRAQPTEAKAWVSLALQRMPAPAGFSRVIGKARLAISVASNDQGASGYVFTLSAAG